MHEEEWTRRIQTDVYAGSVFAAACQRHGVDEILGAATDAVLPLVSDVLPPIYRRLDFMITFSRIALSAGGRLGLSTRAPWIR